MHQGGCIRADVQLLGPSEGMALHHGIRRRMQYAGQSSAVCCSMRGACCCSAAQDEARTGRRMGRTRPRCSTWLWFLWVKEWENEVDRAGVPAARQ